MEFVSFVFAIVMMFLLTVAVVESAVIFGKSFHRKW